LAPSFIAHALEFGVGRLFKPAQDRGISETRGKSDRSTRKSEYTRQNSRNSDKSDIEFELLSTGGVDLAYFGQSVAKKVAINLHSMSRFVHNCALLARKLENGLKTKNPRMSIDCDRIVWWPGKGIFSRMQTLVQ